MNKSVAFSIPDKNLSSFYFYMSDEFIRQGGLWVDVSSQKTEVVSGVLCLAMFVFVLAVNINY